MEEEEERHAKEVERLRETMEGHLEERAQESEALRKEAAQLTDTIAELQTRVQQLQSEVEESEGGEQERARLQADVERLLAAVSDAEARAKAAEKLVPPRPERRGFCCHVRCFVCLLVACWLGAVRLVLLAATRTPGADSAHVCVCVCLCVSAAAGARLLCAPQQRAHCLGQSPRPPSARQQVCLDMMQRDAMPSHDAHAMF